MCFCISTSAESAESSRESDELRTGTPNRQQSAERARANAVVIYIIYSMASTGAYFVLICS